jgi:rhodanese-related sulfurtransferase
MKATVKGLVEEANAKVKTYEVKEAIELVNDGNIQFVDVREDHEVYGEGMIPGAVHASRGMLEYYLDAESPYYKKELATGKKLIFYCKSGGRSALATKRALEMGFANVAHVAGGLNAWKAAGGPLERVENPHTVSAG